MTHLLTLATEARDYARRVFIDLRMQIKPEWRDRIEQAYVEGHTSGYNRGWYARGQNMARTEDDLLRPAS